MNALSHRSNVSAGADAGSRKYVNTNAPASHSRDRVWSPSFGLTDSVTHPNTRRRSTGIGPEYSVAVTSSRSSSVVAFVGTPPTPLGQNASGVNARHSDVLSIGRARAHRSSNVTERVVTASASTSAATATARAAASTANAARTRAASASIPSVSSVDGQPPRPPRELPKPSDPGTWTMTRAGRLNGSAPNARSLSRFCANALEPRGTQTSSTSRAKSAARRPRHASARTVTVTSAETAGLRRSRRRARAAASASSASSSDSARRGESGGDLDRALALRPTTARARGPAQKSRSEDAADARTLPHARDAALHPRVDAAAQFMSGRPGTSWPARGRLARCQPN
eukprot:31057-Pelagococcus_subviridis.AAC.4